MTTGSSPAWAALWQAAYRVHQIPSVLPDLHYRSLAEFVHERCQAFSRDDPKAKAFTCVVPNGMNGSLSFSQVDALSDAFAGYLRNVLKLSAGDRVAVQLPNSLGYPVAAFGVLKAGCVLVNTNPLYTPSEMIHQFNDAGVKALVIVDMFADKLPEVLAKTQVQHVVVAAVSEFFPAIPNAVVRLVQKVWAQVLPPIRVPHVRLRAALRQGSTALSGQSTNGFWKDLKPSDLAVLQYTGGTTGVSKAAMLSHENLLRNVQQMIAMGSDQMQPHKECVLTALPLYHIFAFTANLLGFLSIGARNILIPSPRPIRNLQRAIENYPITWMTGVNTLFNGLLNEEWFLAYPPKHLKASIAGGASLHTTVAQHWREVTKTPISEGYGLTETSPVVSFNPISDKALLGSIGVPAPATDVCLLDEKEEPVAEGVPGELWVKGPQVMQGYWNQPEETARVLKQGWLATGDIATIDAQGFLRIVDRKKDMILVSGFNVYPNEVEDVIAQLDSVLEVAVIGVSDTKTDEAVCAFVVANPDHPSPPTVEQITAHCRQHLASYKVPKTVVLKDQLPKTPIGKVLRRALREEAM